MNFRSICSRFNVGKATALRTVRRVTHALLTLSCAFIKWPDVDNMEKTIQGFDRFGFPNTIGCIDGTYISIPMRKEHGLAYLCRKNFAGIILQVIFNI